jgi:hypothetical protein
LISSSAHSVISLDFFHLLFLIIRSSHFFFSSSTQAFCRVPCSKEKLIVAQLVKK